MSTDGVFPDLLENEGCIDSEYPLFDSSLLIVDQTLFRTPDQATKALLKTPEHEQPSDDLTTKPKANRGRKRKSKGFHFTAHANLKKTLSEKKYYAHLKKECSQLKDKVIDDKKYLAKLPADEIEEIKNTNEKIRRAKIKIEAIENELKLKELKEKLELLQDQNKELLEENTALKSRLNQYESYKSPKGHVVSNEPNEDNKESYIIKFRRQA